MIARKVAFAMLLLALFSLLMDGCQRPSRQLQGLRRILKISGMELAGDFSGDATLGSDWTPSHIDVVPPLKTNHTYVFVRRPPFSHEYFAEQVFPALLEEKGFSIIDRPHKGAGYMYLFMGGPVYTITFAGQGHQYRLATRYTPQVSQLYGMISEVFILQTSGP